MTPSTFAYVFFLLSMVTIAGIVFIYQSRLIDSCSPETLARLKARQISQDVENKPNVDEGKVKALAKMLQDRLEYTTGKWRKRNLMCEDINGTLPCKTRTPCARPWENRTHEDRVRELLATPSFQLSPKQLDTILKLSENIPEADLIIATATSSNHFEEMQAMFKNLHEVVYPKLKNFHVVLFDLGLNPGHYNITQKNCRCQIVKFRFELFAPHVSDLRCFSWKPLIFRAVIAKARKLFVYQDSSIRWSTEFPQAFARALKYGQQTIESFYSDSIPFNSLKQTLDYLNEDACSTRQFGEMQAGIQMNRHDNLIIEALMNPWARCALEESCMCPIKTSAVIKCKGRHLHRCHRFDQSAFNTLMAKLYGAGRYKMSVSTDIHPLKILRGDKNNTYFKT